jgi:hypothetical protein
MGSFLSLNGDCGEVLGAHCRYLTLAGFGGTQGCCSFRTAAAALRVLSSRKSLERFEHLRQSKSYMADGRKRGRG